MKTIYECRLRINNHVELLTPSLLANAFRGELVEQDAGDEL